MDREKILEHDAEGAAFHEGAHYLVADYYKLSACFWMYEVTDGDIKSQKSVVGQAAFNLASCFRHCVICWAGAVGDVLRFGDESQSAEELADEVWDSYEIEGGDSLSQTDLAGINGHRQSRRALYTACRILHARRSELREIVKQATTAILMNRGEVFKWPSGPQSVDELLALIRSKSSS
jgi:hypothetical protein